jgi:GTPase SAR1 family protein
MYNLRALHLFNPQSICLVIGPKGSGKSTVINNLTGCDNDSKSDPTNNNDALMTNFYSSSHCLPTDVEGTPEDIYFLEIPDLTDLNNYTKNLSTSYMVKLIMKKAKTIKLLVVMDYNSINSKAKDVPTVFKQYLRHVSQLIEHQINQSCDLGMVVTKINNNQDSLAIHKEIYGILKREKHLYKSEFPDKTINLFAILQDKPNKRYSFGNKSSKKVAFFRKSVLKQEKDKISIVKLLKNLNQIANNQINFANALTGWNKPFELKKYLKLEISSMVQTVLFEYFNATIRRCDFSASCFHDFMVEKCVNINKMIDDQDRSDDEVNAFFRQMYTDLWDEAKTHEFVEYFTFLNSMLDFLNGRDYHSQLRAFIKYWVENNYLDDWLTISDFLFQLDNQLNIYYLLKIRDFWEDKEAELDQQNAGIVVTKDTFELFLKQLKDFKNIDCNKIMQIKVDDMFLKHLNKVLGSNYVDLLASSTNNTLINVKNKKNIIVVFGYKKSGKTCLIKYLKNNRHPMKSGFRTNMPILYTDDHKHYLEVPGFCDSESFGYSSDSINRLITLLESAKQVKFLFILENGLVHIDTMLSFATWFITDLTKYSSAIGVIVNKVEYTKSVAENPQHNVRLMYDYDMTAESVDKNLIEMLISKRDQYQEMRESSQKIKEINKNRKKVQLLSNILNDEKSIVDGKCIKKITYFCIPNDQYSIVEYELVEKNRERICRLIDHLISVEPKSGDFRALDDAAKINS